MVTRLLKFTVSVRYFLFSAGILAFLAPVMVHAQGADRFLSGRIVDSDSHAPVPYVTIYDARRKDGTAADRDGRFGLQASVGDSLFLTSVGYDGLVYVVTGGEENVTIEMSVATIQLDSITIHAFPTYEQFKREVVKTDVQPKKDPFDLYIPKGYQPPTEPGPGSSSAATSVGVGVGIRGPITALYNTFSREGKERRKLNALHEEENRQAMIDAKYNVDVVERVTHLNEVDAKEFMLYCKLDGDFILKSSDYELALAMLNCLESFKAQKGQQD